VPGQLGHLRGPVSSGRTARHGASGPEQRLNQCLMAHPLECRLGPRPGHAWNPSFVVHIRHVSEVPVVYELLRLCRTAHTPICVRLSQRRGQTTLEPQGRFTASGSKWPIWDTLRQETKRLPLTFKVGFWEFAHLRPMARLPLSSWSRRQPEAQFPHFRSVELEGIYTRPVLRGQLWTGTCRGRRQSTRRTEPQLRRYLNFGTERPVG
jgi:hypothetical protein